MIIKPQPGYQENVLSTSADICISGASAGVGKTFALLLEFTRHTGNKNWGGVIFRRTTPQIRNEGGLWDASMKLYPHLKAVPRESRLEWTFPSGSELKFSHLEYEKDKIDWQGSEIPFIGFDELTHFTEGQFFYLLSRNRTTSGIKPYVRATCNPDPDSWVYELIKWWIDEDTGYPIKERDGVIRYFMKHGSEYVWGNSFEEVYEQCAYIIDEMVEKANESGEQILSPKHFIKSLTFISGSIYDNKELLRANPEYLANLNAQDPETKAQLLDGNWKHVENKTDLFDYYSFIDTFTNDFIPFGKPYITADIAMDGSDKFVIVVWRGFVIVDIIIVDKSDGAMVLDMINEQKQKHFVPDRNICYDNDGVGKYIKGFMKNAIPFSNGGVPIGRENYKNIKTQCYYKLGELINDNSVYIIPEVLQKHYSKTQTVKQRLLQERKCIKKWKLDDDGKKQINPKSEQKIINNGESPDIMDAIMLRAYWTLRKVDLKVTLN